MRSHPALHFCSLALVLLLAPFSTAHAQVTDTSNWTIDLGVGFEPSINGNVNSGAIGTLQGQTAAILPNSFGDVYGGGIEFRFGAGYQWKEDTELRGMFIWQSADANLVRMGDLGPSSLYGQYDDYKSFALDFGVRRYVPIGVRGMRGLKAYGEGTLGIGFINEIDVLFAAPRANVIFDQSDFYDQTAAFTWGINFGLTFPLAERVDFYGQVGLRHVSGLAEIDQLVGTGLDNINNDTGRLTLPVVVGVRLRLK
jgi:hypothetical protein